MNGLHELHMIPYEHHMVSYLSLHEPYVFIYENDWKAYKLRSEKPLGFISILKSSFCKAFFDITPSIGFSNVDFEMLIYSSMNSLNF